MPALCMRVLGIVLILGAGAACRLWRLAEEEEGLQDFTCANLAWPPAPPGGDGISPGPKAKRHLSRSCHNKCDGGAAPEVSSPVVK